MAALKKLPNYDERAMRVESAGKIYCASVKNKKVYFQIHGIGRGCGKGNCHDYGPWHDARAAACCASYCHGRCFG